MEFQLTPEQIAIIGIFAAVIAQLIKIVFAWIGKPIDRKWVTVIILVVGMAFAYIWARPALPQWPAMSGEPIADMLAILGFLISLLLSASALVGIAQPIYNLLLQKVFERIGIGETKIQKLTFFADLRKSPPDVG